MGLLIVVPLLVSGYLVCILHPFFYYRLHRFEGQLLYLQVARLGMACLIAAALVSAALMVLSKQEVYILGHAVATDYSGYLGRLLVQFDVANANNATLWVFSLQVGITAMAIPFAWARFYVHAKKKSLKLKTDAEFHALLLLGILQGTPLRGLLRESFEQYTPCMFSLSDRKVYVGIVILVGAPTESAGIDHTFTLIPLLSGYRDKDTLEVTLNTHYANGNIPRPIILVQANIVSATRFDFATWNTFQSRKNRKARHRQFYQHRPARQANVALACA